MALYQIFKNLKNNIKNFKGQSITEYAIIIGVVVVIFVIVSSNDTLQNEIIALLVNISYRLESIVIL